MNSMAWIGIIGWGLVVAAFGLLSAHPPAESAAGGLVTCLIGVTGLLGFMGWIPGLRKENGHA